jgi:1-acyl-sn-glycerol-3-phosphate acyltransferase
MQEQGRGPSLSSRLARWVILKIYSWKGWKLEGSLPETRKFVIAGAPHTSNWDFVFFTGATNAMGIRPNFMGKHTLFKWPIKRFMEDMGGIPVDRRSRANYVEQVAAEFARRDELALVVAAEGTRKTDGSWKSGFYHIAQAAGVPIVPTWVCNKDKRLGFGPAIWPSGDYAADLAWIAAYFRSILPDEPRFKVLEAQAQRLLKEQPDA